MYINKDMKKLKFVLISFLAVIYIISMIVISYIYTERPVYCKAVKKQFIFNQNSENEVPVYIKNWVLPEVSTENDYFVSYHLFDAEKKLIAFDNIRTPIEMDLSKGKWINQSMKITPLVSGEYYILIDVVQENVRWYSSKYAIKSYVKIIVQ